MDSTYPRGGSQDWGGSVRGKQTALLYGKVNCNGCRITRREQIQKMLGPGAVLLPLSNVQQSSSSQQKHRLPLLPPPPPHAGLQDVAALPKGMPLCRKNAAGSGESSMAEHSS